MNKDDLKSDTITHVERTTSPVTSFDSDVKTGHQDGIQQMLDQGQHIGFAAATEEAARLGVSLSPTSKRSIQLYLICLVCFLNGMVNGFDGSIMGSINVMKQYQSYFGGIKEVGSSTGIVFVLYNFGNIAGSFFAGPIMDILGRRWGMKIGAMVTIIGAIIITASQNGHMFKAGRFLLGFGVSIQITSAPSYVTEIIPPQWRGRLGGAYNCFYYCGSILATGVVYATNQMAGNISWRLPLGLQLFAPSIVLIGNFFIPESPRFLAARGRMDEAKAILTKYHGGDDPNHPLVQFQIREFEEGIKVEKASAFWDYSGLWRTRAALWQTLMVTFMSFFSQWAGNAVLSYFLPCESTRLMLGNVGIKTTEEKLLLTFANSIISAAGAVLGAVMNDTVGRRPRFAVGCVVLAGLLGGVTAVSAKVADNSASNAVAKLGIFFIFFFGFCYSWVYTPNQSLYCAECLNTENRPKGMALHTLQSNLAGVLNTFASSVALAKLSYKYYFVWIGANLVWAVCWWTLGVETRGRTLEEMNNVFDQPFPPSASWKLGKVKKSEDRDESAVVNEL